MTISKKMIKTPEKEEEKEDKDEREEEKINLRQCS